MSNEHRSVRHTTTLLHLAARRSDKDIAFS